jgi:hypothetical protein
VKRFLTLFPNLLIRFWQLRNANQVFVLIPNMLHQPFVESQGFEDLTRRAQDRRLATTAVLIGGSIVVSFLSMVGKS